MEWAKIDVLDEIDPLRNDKQFNLRLLLQSNSPGQARKIGQIVLELENLSGIRNLINSIADVVSRSIGQRDPGELDTSEQYSNQLILQTRQLSSQMQTSTSMIALAQTLGDFQRFVSDEGNIFQIQRQRQQLIDDSEKLVNQNQLLLNRFNQRIETYADAEQNKALDLSRLAFQQSRQAQFVLVLVLLTSLLIALLVAWFGCRSLHRPHY